MNKNIFWSLINVALVILLIIGVKFAFGAWTKVDQSRLITVSGEGKVTVTPDIAHLSFSVVSEGKDPKVLQTDNSGKINQAVEFIKSPSIEDKDIKTSNYSLYPIYDYEAVPQYRKGTPFITGYRLTQTVSLKIRDLIKLNDVLVKLPEFGINEISSVSFDVDEPDQYLNQARQEAFDKAHEKAAIMAKFNGVRLKRVVNFSEGFGGPIYFRAEAFGKGGDAAGVPAPAIEPGSQDITVNVTVTYEIR